MSLLDRFRKGFASSKSSLKILSQVPTTKQFADYWKVSTGKAFEPARVRVTKRNRGRRGLPVLIALAVVASTGSALAQRAVGIDVSDFQSAGINWSTLKNNYGITFGWGKSSEGLASTGAGGNNWPTYVANAKAAGVYFGPYHFARYDDNSGTNGAAAEANYFWSVVAPNVKADGLSLVPMLDVEAATNGYTKTTLSQWVNTWCTIVTNSGYAAGVKFKPAIYGSSSHISAWFDSSVTQWYADVADYAYGTNYQTSLADAQGAVNPPAGITPWTSWQFFQYDDQNAAQPYTKGDGDIYNGTVAQLAAAMLVTQTGPLITSQPASVTAVVGTNVNFSVAATGGGTLQYQWKLNATNVAAATASKYTINNVQLTNAGMYTVSVKDNSGNSILSTNIVYLAVVGPVTNETGSSIVIPAGLVDWWPADGNGHDIYGTVTATPGTNLSYSPGLIDLAFQFDGKSSYLTTGAADIPVPWTASMWVNRANGAGTAAGLLEDGTYSLKLEQFSNTFSVGISQIGVGDYTFSPAYTAPIGTWVHLAFVGTSAGTSLYVNGTFQGAVTNVIPLPRAYIGAGFVTSSAKWVDFLSGSLDEIMLFNQALTATQINSIYSSGSSGLVRAAQLVGSSSPSPGLFTLNLQGETGKTLTIYTSTDLTNWVSTARISDPAGSNNWTDIRATNQPAKYYRVTSP